MRSSWRQKIGLVVVTIVACVIAGIGVAPQASAQYVESNLIDDKLFLDAGSMSTQQIQDFLTARGGRLATYTYWSGRDNAEVSAARIIYEAAYDYGISPKVILATMQKEQSLVTAKNPTNSQLNFAMGYGCPDSTGCGANYSGFYSQVDNGTWQLRYNFERARGNNTWWRVSSSYPCGGSTRYYSPGLYLGNYVTFYDEAGYGYKAFYLNGAATASLYCYTPHAYPGSSSYYYSGSYNFVNAYEAWFGTTQPGVVITSPLRMHVSGGEGNFTGQQVTVSFDMRNNLNWGVNVGHMVVAARDAADNNVDFDFNHVVIPANGTYTYSSTRTFTSEGQYKLWISNFYDNQWSSASPPSTSIDFARQLTPTFQAMPTITLGPTASVTDMREMKQSQMSFKVRNNSASSMNIGKMGLAIFSPNGANVGLPLRDVTLAAGAEYTYNESFTPTMPGTYNAFVTTTRNNGVSWNSTTYPGAASGVDRGKLITTKPNPTITVSPTISANPRAGGSTTGSFTLHNFGTTDVHVGKMGLAIRGPDGENVGLPLEDVTVAAGQDYVYSKSNIFTKPGTYTAWITMTPNNGISWNDTDYPANESADISRRTTFTVKPNPTITVSPTISANPRMGTSTTATFTIHNYANQSVNLGQVALAVRDPQGRNVGYALRNVTIAAGQDYVYSATNVFDAPGEYRAWITQTSNSGQTWNDTNYPVLDSDAVSRTTSFTVLPNPSISVQPKMSNNPHAGGSTTGSFTLHNYGTSSAVVGKIGMAVRGPDGENVGLPLEDVTIAAGQDYVYSKTTTQFTKPGTYTAWVTLTKDNGNTWDDTTYPIAESGITRKFTFTVKPSVTITVKPSITSDLHVGQTATATFTIHNYSASSVNVGLIGLAVRAPDGANVGLPVRNVTIAAGQDYVYSESRVFSSPGSHTAWITVTQDNGITWNDTTYPANESDSISRYLSFNVAP